MATYRTVLRCPRCGHKIDPQIWKAVAKGRWKPSQKCPKCGCTLKPITIVTKSKPTRVKTYIMSTQTLNNILNRCGTSELVCPRCHRSIKTGDKVERRIICKRNKQRTVITHKTCPKINSSYTAMVYVD